MGTWACCGTQGTAVRGTSEGNGAGLPGACDEEWQMPQARRGRDRCQDSGRIGALPGSTLEARGAGGRYASRGAVARDGTEDARAY